MRRAINARPGFLMIATFLLIVANPAFGQQPPDEQTENVETQEPVFKIEGDFALEKLKDKIPEEKKAAIEEKLKGQTFTKDQLQEILSEQGIFFEEIDALISEARERTKFLTLLQRIGPIALSIHSIEKEIAKLRQELKDAQSEEVKADVSGKIEIMTAQAESLQAELGKLAADVKKGQLEDLRDDLALAGFKDAEPEIIANQILEEIEFLKKMKTLETIIRSIDKLHKDIVEQERELKNAENEDQKTKISEALKQLSSRLRGLEHDYTAVITGIDINALREKEKKKKVNWDDELKEIFSPIIIELKEVTDRPRRMETLRGEVSYYQKRLPQINRGVENIEKLMEEVRNPIILERLRQSKEFWKQQRQEFTSKLETAEHQLFELEKNTMTIRESIDYFIEFILKHRGKNILVAAIAFFSVFLIFHLFRLLVKKINPLKLFPKYSFLTNIIDVMLYMLTFFAATVAMVVALYGSGDWLILGIVILVLLGLVWAARNTLPMFVEQIKLLLGFGPVRQGERVYIDGIPYNVESIGIYCFFTNPALTGGTVRLPLKDLIEMRSRPYEDTEHWFPCQPGDWVLINGACRLILQQTPKTVTVSVFDMVERMKTSGFLGNTIRNLSETPFHWVGRTVYIAYRHRRQALEIRTKMYEFLEAEFKREYGDALESPFVEITELAESSIGVLTWARLKTAACRHYIYIRDYFIPTVVLKACNAYGWELIRFTHVQLDGAQPPATQAHRAIDGGPVETP